MSDLRTRRIAAERRFLDQLAAANPGRLELLAWSGDAALVRLLDTPAYLGGGLIARVHDLRLNFPEYYPAVPLEAFLERPVLHPNVHPGNGFICLWDRHAAGDTVVETLRQVQRVITWRLRNDSPEHVMQASLAPHPPLAYEPVSPPAGYTLPPDPQAKRRRRLSNP